MTKIILIAFLYCFIISCRDNSLEPESQTITGEINITNFKSEAAASKLENSDSVKITFSYSFNYKFVNCSGYITIFRVHLPFNKYHYSELMNSYALMDEEYFWEEEIFLITDKEIPVEYDQRIDIEGHYYFNKLDDWKTQEEFKKKLNNKVLISRNY